MTDLEQTLRDTLVEHAVGAPGGENLLARVSARQRSHRRGLLVRGLAVALVAVVAVAGVSLTGLGRQRGDSVVAVSPSETPLDKLPEALLTTWVVPDFEVGGGDAEPVQREPYISFAPDGTWIANDGTNSGGGTYEVSAAGDFSAQPGPWTTILCGPRCADMDTWLDQARSVSLADDVLTLTDETGRDLVELESYSRGAGGDTTVLRSHGVGVTVPTPWTDPARRECSSTADVAYVQGGSICNDYDGDVSRRTAVVLRSLSLPPAEHTRTPTQVIADGRATESVVVTGVGATVEVVVTSPDPAEVDRILATVRGPEAPATPEPAPSSTPRNAVRTELFGASVVLPSGWWHRETTAGKGERRACLGPAETSAEDECPVEFLVTATPKETLTRGLSPLGGVLDACPSEATRILRWAVLSVDSRSALHVTGRCEAGSTPVDAWTLENGAVTLTASGGEWIAAGADIFATLVVPDEWPEARVWFADEPDESSYPGLVCLRSHGFDARVFRGGGSTTRFRDEDRAAYERTVRECEVPGPPESTAPTPQ